MADAELETTDEQESARTSDPYLRILALLSVFCITASVFIFMTLVLLLKLNEANCPGCRQNGPRNANDRTFVKVLLSVALSLLFIGCGLLLVYWKLSQNSSTHNVADSVVISPIPPADLEKTPAPVLPYNHIPQRQLFMNLQSPASSTDLPDYLTVVQDTNNVYLTVDADIWTEDVPETPPPCYEKALELTIATTSEADTFNFQQESTENTDTRL